MGKTVITIATICFALLIAGCSQAGISTAQWNGCKAYATQPEAQTAWEAAGRPASANPSGDGEACKSLPQSSTKKGSSKKQSSKKSSKKSSSTSGATATTTDCSRPSKPVAISVDRAKYPETTLHIETAIAHGAPAVLHIDRIHTDENRQAWEALVPKAIDAQHRGAVDDRDEWPMAATVEGGNRTKSGKSLSDIAFVNAGDNRGAGSSIGGRLRKYCDGVAFKVYFVDRRKHKTTIVEAARNGKRINQVVTVNR